MSWGAPPKKTSRRSSKIRTRTTSRARREGTEYALCLTRIVLHAVTRTSCSTNSGSRASGNGRITASSSATRGARSRLAVSRHACTQPS